MSEVGIRALRQNASEIISRAAAGEIIVITDRGRPVAQITPLPNSRMQQLIDAGLVRLPTRDLTDLPPPEPGPSLSEEIQRIREERL